MGPELTAQWRGDICLPACVILQTACMFWRKKKVVTLLLSARCRVDLLMMKVELSLSTS